MRAHFERFSHFATRKESVNLICALLFASVLIAFLRYTLTNSWFMGQDFHHLLLLQEKPFSSFLLTPIDIHFPLPLHRFFCWLFYKELKMNFLAAVLFLGILFFSSAIYLYKTLQLIQPTRLNPILMTLYAGNVYLLDLFLWWSSGLHRLPYILCAIACCYHALIFQKKSKKMDIFFCLLYFIVAFGFFEKAILIPAYIAALISCDSLLTKEKVKPKIVALVVTMGLISAIYSAALIIISNHQHLVNNTPSLFFATLQMGVKKSLQTLLPFPNNTSIFSHAPPIGQYTTLFIFCAFMYSVFRRNLHAVIIGILFFTLLYLNFLPAAASNRAEEFSPFFIFLTRYYFENTFLFLVFATLIYKSFKRNTSQLRPRRPIDIPIMACLFMAFINALFAYRGAVSTALREYSVIGGHTEASYVKNLKNGLEYAANSSTAILNQPLPAVMYDSSDEKLLMPSLSTLAAEWQLPVKFGDSESAEFYVDNNGNLQRTR